LSNINICQIPIFVKYQYLSNTNICQIPIFDQYHNLWNINICQTSIFVEYQYHQISKFVKYQCSTNISIYVKYPYLSNILTIYQILLRKYYHNINNCQILHQYLSIITIY
jgi:hypothetical protein